MAILPALQGMFQLKQLNGILKNKDNISESYFFLNSPMGGYHPATLKRFARSGQTFEDKSRGFHAAVDSKNIRGWPK